MNNIDSFHSFCNRVDKSRAIQQTSMSKKDSREIRKQLRLLDSYSHAGTLLEKIKNMSKQEQKDEIVRMALTFLIEIQNRPDGDYRSAPQLLALLNKLLMTEKIDVTKETHTDDTEYEDVSDVLGKFK